MRVYRNVCIIFCVLWFYSSTSSAQAYLSSNDSLYLDIVWEWIASESNDTASYFMQTYTIPLFPSEVYTIHQYQVYHFPDRCIDNVVVIDTTKLIIEDVCIGECKWLKK
jgi:hypothetical protein